MISDYLSSGFFIDSDNQSVINYAHSIVKESSSQKEKAIALYYAIRDGFSYNPYKIDLRPNALKASNLLTRNYGYCIEKASLLAACARTVGIPSRLQFANVINHIGTEKLERELGTNLLVFHGYTELLINDKWIKATPAFNKSLCDFIGVKPLEFDGETDSIFQEYNADGSNFMEYVHEYGSFPDIPRDLFISELKRHYPHIFNNNPLKEKGIHFIVE